MLLWRLRQRLLFFEAAPFPEHGVGSSYVDGGVWANSPAMVAVTEAIAFLGARPGEIDILSIGTTQAPFSIAANRNAGALGWNTGIIDLMFQSQAEAALAQAKLIAGNLHRIDFTTVLGRFSLDGASSASIGDLAAAGRSIADDKFNIDAVSNRFLNGVFVKKYQQLSGVAAAVK